ncbi:MAG: GNAT family N-acetyltransferase [Bacilli bacterium]|nr:GNAT family N-acetyltransferase [Bacilli bacterium]
MIFEFLKEKEIDSLINLLEEAFTLKANKETIKESLNNKNIRFLCAKEDNKVIGTIMITTKINPVTNKNGFYLDYVSVLESYQNRKIGAKMMLEVEKIAKEENISYIEFTSSSKRIYARKLYLSLGYELRDTGVFIKNI